MDKEPFKEITGVSGENCVNLDFTMVIMIQVSKTDYSFSQFTQLACLAKLGTFESLEVGLNN